MSNTKITSAVIKDANILTAAIADAAVTSAKIADDVALAGNPTAPTQTAGNNSTRLATTAYADDAVSGALMDSELTDIASVKALNQGVATGDSPTFAALTSTGAITANGGIALGDGDVATFNSNLSIFSSGTTSYIQEAGAGDLYLKASSLYITDRDNNQFMSLIDNGTGGTVSLMHNTVTKLATTATGIDVTGTITSTAFGSQLATTSFVQNAITTTVGSSSGAFIRMAVSNAGNPTYSFDGDTNTGMFTSSADTLNFSTAGTERLTIAASGDLTGTSNTTGLAASFLNSHADGYGMRVTTYSNAVQYGFAVDSYGGGYSRDFTVGVDGNVNVLTGNLVIGTAGKGIDFSANGNASGMTSEVLDSYEEGTFTPTFVNMGNGTYSVQSGNYTKIGNQCFCHIYLDINALGTASGSIVVGALPFSSANVGNLYGATSAVHGTSWTTATAGLQGLVAPNGTQIVFYENMATTGSGYTTAMADIGTGNLLFSLTYTTA